MAPRTKAKTKRPTITEDSLGKPDIYALCEEHDITPTEAAEMAGIAESTAYQLWWRQEVEHNPELKVKPAVKKDRAKLGAYIVKMRTDGEDGVKLRWERLSHRTGLSVAELKEVYEEYTGESATRLRGGKSEDEDESPKAKRNGNKASTRKAKAAPVDDEEDDEDVEEEAPRPKRRAKARR